MARLNEIQVGRFNRFFQKLLAIKGGPPVPSLGPELTPTFPLRNGVENLYLESFERFAFAIVVAGVAGDTSDLQLRNPTGSNIVAIVEKAVVSAALGGEYELQFGQPGTSDLATIGVARSLDTRARPKPSSIVSSGTPVGGRQIGNTIIFAQLPGNGYIDFVGNPNQEILLLPGDAIEMQSDTLAQTAFFSVYWRERFLEESERT